MTENLDKFSETRWPVPLDPDVPNGDNRKALSRYITSYLAELRKSDPDLFNETVEDPTLSLNELETESGSQLTLQEYLKEQNQVFNKLSGFKSYTQLSQAETQADQSNTALCKSLEIYLAALDEKSYVNVCNTRISLGMRDAEVRNAADELEQELSKLEPEQSQRELLKLVIQLRKQMQLLWTKHTFLCQQRDQVEIDLGVLRNDHALQLAKVFRLQYATQCLGKKLIEANAARKQSAELEKTVAKQEQEIADLAAENDALKQALAAATKSKPPEYPDPQEPETPSQVQPETQPETQPQPPQSQPPQPQPQSQPPNAPDERVINEYLAQLYSEVLRLKASEEWTKTHKNEEEDVSKLLANLIALIELNQTANSQKQVLLVRAFLKQYHARESELLTQTKVLQAEKRIILARCEKHVRKCRQMELDLEYAEKRSLSMVLMLKNMKVFLE